MIKALYATVEDHKHTRFGSAYSDMLERTDPQYKSNTALANLKRNRPANIDQIGEPMRDFVNWIEYRHRFEPNFAYLASQKPHKICDAMFAQNSQDKIGVIREMRDNYIQLNGIFIFSLVFDIMTCNKIKSEFNSFHVYFSDRTFFS